MYSYQTFTALQVLTAAQVNQVEANIKDHPHALAGVGSIFPVAVAGGSVNAITATYASPVTTLNNGMVLGVECSGANTAAVTFNPDGTGARNVYKGAMSALGGGDIPGANFLALFRYDASVDQWQLLNPQAPRKITWASLFALGAVDGSGMN